MRNPFRSRLVQVALVLAVAGVAYLAGLMRDNAEKLKTTPSGRGQADAAETQRLSSSSLNITRPNNNRPNPPGSAAIKQAMELSLLFRRDPKLALAELDKLPLGMERQFVITDLFQILANDPAMASATAAVALDLPPGQERDAALKAVIAHWGLSDTKGLLSWASSLPPEDAGLFRDALINVSNIEANPALAAQYLDKVADASARNQVIGVITAAMARNDPAGTLDWLDQVATGTAYDTNVKSIFADLSTHDPTQAAALLGKITEPDVQAAATNLAKAWGGSDPQAALAWAQTLPDAASALRNQALNSVVGSWAQKDPAAALAFVQGSSSPALYLGDAPAIAQSLSKSDPDAAMTYAQALPDGTEKNQAISNILVNVAAGNFTLAWNQAAAQPEGVRDTALVSLVGVQAQKDPAQAVALVNQLPAGTIQINATGALASTWVLQNPDAFMQWAGSLPAGAQRDAALSAAQNAIQSSKLPEPQRDVLAQKFAAVPDRQ